MNILFVDDYPDVKVRQAIEYLKEKQFDFTYTIAKSYHSAVLYLSKNFENTDLAVIDLGLPVWDNGDGYNKLEGVNLISLICWKNLNIPIVINSSTEIPNEEEYLQNYIAEGANIKHVKTLYGEWLYDFIKSL